MLRSFEDTELAGRRSEIRLPLSSAAGSGAADAQAQGRSTSRWVRCAGCCIPFEGSLQVRLVLSAQYFFVCGTEVALGALFDAYLLIRLGTNTWVGTVESARGIAALLLAVPIGWGIDKHPRSKVLRCNAWLGVLSAVCLLVGYPVDGMPLIVAGCVMMGIHNQCLFSIFPVLVKEATADGPENAAAQSNMQTVSSIGRASGPFLQLLLILVTGSGHWSSTELHWVLLSGLVFFAAYLPFVFRVAHLQTLGEVGEGTSAVTPGSSIGTPSSRANAPTPKWNWTIAALCEFSSLVTSIGSGMTFKYWTLFFKQDFGFNPAQSCIMNLAMWLAIALSNQACKPVVRWLGRLPVANLLHVSGTCLLFLISNQSLGVAVEVPLVIMRNALMNAGGPLVQSLILELVPSKHRGKWSSLSSLRRMTWSGSAFLGGMLSDQHDYRYAFFITACVHTAAGAVLLLVNFLVHIRPIERATPGDDTSRVANLPDCALNSFGSQIAGTIGPTNGSAWPEALDESGDSQGNGVILPSEPKAQSRYTV